MRYDPLRRRFILLLMAATALLATPPGPNGPPAVAQTAPWRLFLPRVERFTARPWEIIGRAGGTSQSIALQGDLAFAGVGSQMHVFDIADLDAPRERARLTLEAPIHALAASGEALYAARFRSEGFDLWTIDLRRPDRPRIAAHAFVVTALPIKLDVAPPRPMRISGARLVVGGNVLVGFDLSAPLAPRQTWSLTLAGQVDRHRPGPAFDLRGDRLVVAGDELKASAASGSSERIFAGLRVYALAGDEPPALQGELAMDLSLPIDLGLAGPEVAHLVLGGGARVQVVDLADPAAPSLVGGPRAAAARGGAVWLEGSLITADDGAGQLLQGFDTRDPRRPRPSHTARAPGRIERIAGQGDRLLLLDPESALRLAQFDPVTGFRWRGQVVLPGVPVQLAADAGRVYSRDAYGHVSPGRRVSLLDGRDPRELAARAHFDADYRGRVFAADGLLLLPMSRSALSPYSGLQIWDLRRMEAPVLRSAAPIDGALGDVVTENERAWLIVERLGTDQLMGLDFGDPERSPRELAKLDLPKGMDRLFLSGPWLYVVRDQWLDQSALFLRFDISDLEAPTLEAQIKPGGEHTGGALAVEGGCLAMARIVDGRPRAQTWCPDPAAGLVLSADLALPVGHEVTDALAADGEAGRLLVAAGGYDIQPPAQVRAGTTLLQIDVRDGASPRLLQAVPFTYPVDDLALDGDIAYLAAGGHGVLAIAVPGR